MPQWIEMTRSPEYSPKLIGQELVFLQNDFRELLSDLGDVAFVDKIEKAMLGETIIIGGYLNTNLIKAKSILAEHLNVDSLSAISADIGEVTSGTITGATIRTSSSGNRVQLDGTNLKAYYNGIRRVQLDYDTLDFYSYANRLAGSITAGEFNYSVFGTSGHKVISVPGLQLDVGTGGLIILESRNGQKSSGIKLLSGDSDYYGHLKMQVYDGPSSYSLFEINGSGQINISTSPGVVGGESGVFINGSQVLTRELVSCGKIYISPTANSPSSIRVYFPVSFKSAPIMVASALSGFPGTDVREVTVTNVSKDYADIVIYRTSATTTTLLWIAMEPR